MSIELESPGWLISLCKNDNSSTIFKAKLHNPMKILQKLQKMQIAK